MADNVQTVTRSQLEDLLRDAVVDSLEPCEPKVRAARFARVELLRNALKACPA